MMSMAARYGLRCSLRKAAVVLAFPIVHGNPAIVRAAVPRLLVLGDSLAAGYGLPAEDGFEAQLADALRDHGHPVKILDGAVSGDTTAGGRARLDWALGDGADAAIVELGANDGLRGIDRGRWSRTSRHPGRRSRRRKSRCC